MSETAKKRATYEDLYSIPDNMIGEIINGELIVQPRLEPRHSGAAFALGYKIGPYQFGQGGGLGGWVFRVEVEVLLGEQLVVPDLAGWRKERFPAMVETNWISVVPDWVCEILSPKRAVRDRTDKMSIYAEHGVEHFCLVDPLNMTLDAFRLESDRWVSLGVFGGNQKARLEPFQEIEINLSDLWLQPPA